jgi:glycine betaine/choline ABC-type transport system substrate-binding protein
MEEKVFKIVENEWIVATYFIMSIAKRFPEPELTKAEACIAESLNKFIENLSKLVSLADEGHSDAHKIVESIKEFATTELIKGTYLGSSIDSVCEYTGSLLEYLGVANEKVRDIFLAAIKGATVKLGVTVDISVKDTDVRWLLGIENFETDTVGCS